MRSRSRKKEQEPGRERIHGSMDGRTAGQTEMGGGRSVWMRDLGTEDGDAAAQGPAHCNADADRTCALRRVKDTEGNAIVRLEKGNSIGMWSLMGDTDASSPYGFPVVFVAATHVHANVISMQSFQNVLAICPKELVDEVSRR